MLGGRKDPPRPAAVALPVAEAASHVSGNGHRERERVNTLLTVIGDHAKIEGKLDIADSIQIECEVGGELRVGGKLVIGERGMVHADVQTVARKSTRLNSSHIQKSRMPSSA